ncbi:MAG: SUMF1/EgtB/PvdO family nonheme iron enzyme [Bacteroidales bacterium]|jgi:formylglycine-generating enzyme required for sulfatase activity
MNKINWLSGVVLPILLMCIFFGSCTKNLQNLPPTASFTVTPHIAMVDSAVIFDATQTTDDHTSMEMLEYRWDFNNDGMWETDWSSDPIVSEKYKAVGYYTIGMEVKDQAGITGWVSRNATIVDSSGYLVEFPVAVFTMDPFSGDENTLFTFNASGCHDVKDDASLLMIRWDFDNNGSWDTDWSTEKIATHKYEQSGLYDIILQVRDLDGNIDGECKQLVVGSGGGDIIDLSFVSIPGGTFQMGCTQTNTDACELYDETPVRSVTVNAFQLSKYEITNKQYADFLNVIGCSPDGSLGGEKFIFIGAKNCKITFSGGSFSAVLGNHKYPVCQVTWSGAVAFCNQYGGRLPTEAEWEFAAKGGNNPGNYVYAGSNNINDVAWHAANSGDVNHNVGTKNPNQLGVYDMSGNVMEWCSDWYAFDYYTLDENDNPFGPVAGEERTVRGGSAFNGESGCRVSDRFKVVPTSSAPEIGFRMVK